MNKAQQKFKRTTTLSIVALFTFFLIFSLVPLTNVFSQQVSSVNEAPVMTAEQAKVAQFALIAAAIAFGFGAIGAGIAIAHVGAAAIGSIAEKPEIASQALIFIALAEGLVVFGFITALMILGKV